jgi:hypothetical protein
MAMQGVSVNLKVPVFTQMKQQTNNSQSTTAQALTSFPENPQLYIFAYTITGILYIS